MDCLSAAGRRVRHVDPVLANVIAWMVSSAWSFGWNRRFTFRSDARDTARTGVALRCGQPRGYQRVELDRHAVPPSSAVDRAGASPPPRRSDGTMPCAGGSYSRTETGRDEGWINPRPADRASRQYRYRGGEIRRRGDHRIVGNADRGGAQPGRFDQQLLLSTAKSAPSVPPTRYTPQAMAANCISGASSSRCWCSRQVPGFRSMKASSICAIRARGQPVHRLWRVADRVPARRGLDADRVQELRCRTR